jgi:hypothetical protein
VTLGGNPVARHGLPLDALGSVPAAGRCLQRINGAINLGSRRHSRQARRESPQAIRCDRVGRAVGKSAASSRCA